MIGPFELLFMLVACGLVIGLIVLAVVLVRRSHSRVWQDGDLIEAEIGDGNGHVELPSRSFVWCRPVDTGTATVMRWQTDESVPPEGTLVSAEYRHGMLFYPRYPQT